MTFVNVPMAGPDPRQLALRTVPSVDDAVRWSRTALLALAGAAVLAWVAIGDDERGVTRVWALVAAAALGIVALLALLPLAASVRRTFQESGSTDPRRPGRGRALALLLVTVVAVVAVVAAVAPRVTEAQDEQRSIDRAEEAEQRAADAQERAIADAAAATTTGPTVPVRLIDDMGAPIVDLPAGTCLNWSEGPSVADELHHEADGATATVAACEQPHGYEVIGSVSVGGEGYPGAVVLIDAAAAPCRELLLDYLTPKGGTRPSATAWGAYGVAPRERVWVTNPDQRRVACVAMPPRWGVTRTGSLAGAG